MLQCVVIVAISYRAHTRGRVGSMLSMSYFLFCIILKTLYEIDIIIISISQMKKLKVTEVKWHIWSYRAVNW